MSIINNEILNNLANQTSFSKSYVALMATSGILAAVSLLTNSVPVLIGSMVVAPALAPLGLISFALVSLHWPLAFRGFLVAIGGILIATLFSMVTTYIMNITGVIPPETNLLDKPLLEERVNPGWYSLVAALAAGVAGTIALVKDKTDTLVGVVAALALVPTAGAAGIAFISSDEGRFIGGLFLLGINVFVIILAGLLTLLIIKPGKE
ncbi:MAG: DUF389 domain-containing protein [Candidatus Cyclobacteriaceae bacterium M3_2C_046]